MLSHDDPAPTTGAATGKGPDPELVAMWNAKD